MYVCYMYVQCTRSFQGLALASCGVMLRVHGCVPSKEPSLMWLHCIVYMFIFSATETKMYFPSW